jgi:FkbM family methyltransferase
MSAADRAGKLLARTRSEIDRRRPNVPVQRSIRGIPVWMPRHHLLPYFTSGSSPYNLNLVDLAKRLIEREGDLVLLDVGANVGDSALSVVTEVPAHVVCVEADPGWVEYLRRNVGQRPDVTVEPFALMPPDFTGGFEIQRHELGSSHLSPVPEGTGAAMISVDELRARNPRLEHVRLIKTDTDGYDVSLVPAMARTFAASQPIIFLEFDTVATSLATPDLDPTSVWSELLAQGYEDAVLWSNAGHLMGPDKVENLIGRTAELTGAMSSLYFWDVAVAHRDDPVGLEVLASFAT